MHLGRAQLAAGLSQLVTKQSHRLRPARRQDCHRDCIHVRVCLMFLVPATYAGAFAADRVKGSAGPCCGQKLPRGQR